MRILELFSGTASFSNVAKEVFGYDIFTVDSDPSFNPDLCVDIALLNPREIDFNPDVIWSSVPCTTYSVASFPAGHRDNGIAVSDTARLADRLVLKTLEFVEEFSPWYWIIENPVGLLRKMPFMEGIPKVTVTYCQYGATNMKKTDLFGELPASFIPRCCKNGDTCHEEARRGSKTGTQGLDLIDRSRIPFKLCWELLNSMRKDKTDYLVS